MSLKKEVLLKAVVVSVLWGPVATLCLLLVTSSYLAPSNDGQFGVVSGLEAVQVQILALGYAGYLSDVAPIFLFTIAAVFVGCIIHFQWAAKVADK